MTANSTYDVAIIGTGWSGLSAARALQAKGKKVLVLEAQDRRGGRALSRTIDGMIVDAGCSMIHGYDKGNPAREIAEAFGADVQVLKGGLPRVYAHGAGAGPVDAGALVAEAARAGAGGVDTARVDRAAVPGATSLAAHFASFAPRADALAFLRLNELGPGIPLEAIALRYWKYERSFAGVDAAPVKGYAALVGEVWESVEGAAVNPVKVVLNAEVTALEHLVAAGAVKVTTRDPRDATAAPTTYTVPVVLSTIPLGVLKEKATTSFFSPPLPPSTLGALQRSRSGDLNKIYLAYPSVWWPGGEEKLLFLGPFTPIPAADTLRSPDDIWAHTTLIAENVASSISSRASDGNKAVLLFMVGANAAQALERFSDEEIQASLHAFLVRRLGGAGSTAPVPSAVLVTRWRADPWARGAASTPVTVESDGPLDFIELGRSVWDDHLFFAGEHTELDHHGSVPGAILSGEREAAKILTAFKSRQ
ncbi:hypothetical protein HDZ31DRAFT_60784 [Schizophyllum fasciatum]